MHGNDVRHAINQFDVIADDGIDASKRTGSRHTVPVAINRAVRKVRISRQHKAVLPVRNGPIPGLSPTRLCKPARNDF
jgi:hypothetical protein